MGGLYLEGDVGHCRSLQQPTHGISRIRRQGFRRTCLAARLDQIRDSCGRGVDECSGGGRRRQGGASAAERQKGATRKVSPIPGESYRAHLELLNHREGFYVSGGANLIGYESVWLWA